MQQPAFTLADVRFAESNAVFKRAQTLYRSGKVKNISVTPYGYAAIVEGTHPYAVSLSKKRIDEGNCSCYLGQNNRLCKHMLALALAVLFLTNKEDASAERSPPITDLAVVKEQVIVGMRKLQHFSGPSRNWFSYQRKLATGAGIITDAVSGLPPSEKNATFLWNVIERLDKKLMNSVDDSDGVLGECADTLLGQLAGYAKTVPALRPTIEQFAKRKTNFNFEITLRDILK